MADDLERRLRDSLRGYADLVDAPDDGTLPAQPVRPRPLPVRWRGALLAAAAVAAVVFGTVVVVQIRNPGVDSATGAVVSRTDGTSTAPAESPRSTAAEQALPAPAAGQAPPPSPEPGVPYPVDLSTHCGVRGIDVGGIWFAADPPLVEEGGKPPAGWGNPDQPGTLTLLTATEARFADRAGHEVRLRADERARPEPCD